VVLGVVSMAGLLPGAEGLSSSSTSSAALRLTIPVLLAGLGGLFSERAGIVNIGLEGMMVLGTWLGAWGGLRFGPWWGVVFGMVGGAAGGLVHAIVTVRLGVDHIVSGVVVNLLAVGVVRFLSAIAYEGSAAGGGITQSPRVPGAIGKVTLPFLAGGKLFGRPSPDLLGWLERTGVPVVGDGAGVAKGLVSGVSWLAVLAVGLVPVSAWLLWRTSFGLRLRFAGEQPWAAHSLGVDVNRVKTGAVVISGALAGLGGAVLVFEGAGIYREGQTGGRGFIGLAVLIFGNWRPAGVALGAALFGAADALALRDERAVHALLLLAGLALAVVGGGALIRRQAGRAARALVSAAGFLLCFAATDTIPRQLVSTLPYVVTLAVLAFAPRRLRPPAFNGVRFRPAQLE
jgi:simple sugar transport system permease protein